MPKTYLTYSRDLGDFKHDLLKLHKEGLHGIRLIYKGKTIMDFVKRINEILEYSRANKFDVDILVDLPGEKALIGNMGEGMKIEKGGTYILCDTKNKVGINEIPTLNFFKRLKQTNIGNGDIISIADGEVEMKIVSMNENEISCVALNSFLLTSNRSFNVRGDKLPASAVSREDKLFLEEIKSLDLAEQISIVVSFVTSEAQVKAVKQISSKFKIVSKIENIISEKELEEIIEVSDALMLGRGDLTSTSKMSEVFAFQKLIIEKCNSLNKELILATGLFGDLKNSGKPSISDVMDFGFLRNSNVNSFLIAGSNANHFPFETLELINNFENL